MAEKMNGLYYSMRVRDSIDEAKEYCGLLLSSANKPALKWILRYKRYYKHRPPITRPEGTSIYPLQLHLLPEIARRRLNEFLLGVTGSVAFLVLQEHHAAAYITGGDDRGLHQYIIGNTLNGL